MICQIFLLEVGSFSEGVVVFDVIVVGGILLVDIGDLGKSCLYFKYICLEFVMLVMIVLVFVLVKFVQKDYKKICNIINKRSMDIQ